MNQAIVDYLTQNKEQYAQEALVAQLQKAGHPQGDITEAVAAVYGEKVELVESASHKNRAQYWAGFAMSFFGIIIFNLLALILFGILYYVLQKEHHDLAAGMLHGMRTILVIILGLIILGVIIGQLSSFY